MFKSCWKLHSAILSRLTSIQNHAAHTVTSDMLCLVRRKLSIVAVPSSSLLSGSCRTPLFATQTCRLASEASLAIDQASLSNSACKDGTLLASHQSATHSAHGDSHVEATASRPSTNPNRTKGSQKSKLINKKQIDFGRPRYACLGFATAEQYQNMSKIHTTLAATYAVHTLPEEVGNDAVFCSLRPTAIPTVAIPAFRKDFVVFWDGVVVFWNCTKDEQTSVLNVLRPYEHGSHPQHLVESEVEHVDYLVADGGPARVVNNTIVLSPSCSPLAVSETDVDIEPSVLTKFAFSEAIRLSVRLAIWENQLVTLVESVDGVIDDLRNGRRLRISRPDVLRHCGDLLSFRHRVNLASDLLQTPDFYWDRPHLEELFRRTRSFLNVPHRTRLVNEKLNHCFELVELLRSHLNDSHHTRLEWMIIVLIMIEVVFDALPALGRYWF